MNRISRYISKKDSKNIQNSQYAKIRKHIDMNRVKKLHEEKVAKQIALQEKKYLLYFTENVVPKYYNWETGQFNENSLTEIRGAIFKRLEEIENALSEGMTVKDFKYLYGDGIGSIITSVNPTLVSSTFAQDLVSASAEVTSHMFGPDFPGSFVHSIGDFDKPESLSKVDAQAHLARASDAKAAAAPHDEDHVFAYQSTDFVLPTAEQMTANMTTVASGDFFSDQMKQMIWPSYGQQSPIPGTDIVQGPNGPEVGQLSRYSYPWNHHVYPDDAYFEGLGYDMSNLTAEQQETVIRSRVSFVGGKYGGVSGTYDKDNHFLDITYGTARSIDETSFDIVGGGIYNWDDPVEWPNLQQLDLGPGWGWEYRSDSGENHSLTKEHWQYQENSEEFHVSHLEDIIGVTFPAVKDAKYKVDGEIENYYHQPGGFHNNMEDGDLPGTNDVNYASAYNECSAHKKIIQNAHVGDVITFNYRIASEEWDNEAGYDITGNGDGPYFDSFEPNELYVVAGKRIMKVWSLYRELPDDECTEDYGFVLRNTESPVDTGTFSYTIQQEDINPVTGALDFVTSYHADDLYFNRVSITNFAINQTRTAAGQTGKTTDAYNLGAPVAALNPNNKKKKEEEEEEAAEIFKSETAELSDKDVELQVKEKQRLKDIAAAEAAEEAAEQERADKAQESSVNLDGMNTWEGKIPTRYGIDIEDFTVNQDNPVTVPRGLFGGNKYVTSIEEFNTYQTAAGIPLFAFDSDINQEKDFWNQFSITQQDTSASGRVHTFERNEYTPFITHIQSFTTQYMKDNPEFAKERIEVMIKHPVYRADFLAKTSPEFRKWILGLDVEVGDQWLGKYSKPNLWPKGRSGFASAYGGWWIPAGDSHEDMVEAVKRAFYLFGPLEVNLSLDPKGPDPNMRLDDDPYAIEDPFFKEEEDDEMNLITDLLKKAAEDPFSLTDEEIRILKKYGYEDEVSEMNDLRKLVEDSGVDWSSILKTLLDVGNVALDVAAIIGILFPEPGSSAAGLARLLPRLKALKGLLRRRMQRGALNPFGQRTVRSGPAGRKRVDVYSGRPYQGKRKYGDTTYASTDPQTAATYTHPDLLRGLPGRGGSVSSRGTRDKGTLPQRYIDKYGSRSVYGQQQIKLGKKAARRTFGETFILENKQKNILGDIDNTIDIFMELLNKLPDDKVNETIQKFEKYAADSNLNKNAYRDFSDNITRENNSEQIRKNKLKSNSNLQKPNPNALYPGQPSPNGFPDTPPPKLAPNGYHPDFGKQAKMYRKLDPVSAVVMNKVGTDDPEINKLVAAAAKKPKVELVPNTRKKKDKISEAVWSKGLWSKVKRHW